MQITHVIVHTPNQVREIVREAMTIAAESGADDEWHALIFEQACELLGARYTLAMMPQPVPLNMNVLPNLKAKL